MKRRVAALVCVLSLALGLLAPVYVQGAAAMGYPLGDDPQPPVLPASLSVPDVSVTPDALFIHNEAGASGAATVVVQDPNTPPRPILSVTATSSDLSVVASPGALSLDAQGRCVLDLAPAGAEGTATITITATNDVGSATATLSVTVTAAPVAPVVALSASAVTLEDDETETVAVSVTDGNAPPLDIQSVTVASSDPSVLDPAPALQKGEDGRYLLPLNPKTVSSRQVVTLSVTATNTAGKSSTETLSVTVDPATIAPVLAFPEAPFTTAEDQPYTLDVLNSPYFENAGGIPVELALDATVTQANGTAGVAGGVLTYQPNPDHFTPAGQQASDTIGLLVRYQKNGQPKTVAAALRIKVTPEADAPRPADDAHSATAGTALDVTAAELLANDLSVDGDPLEIIDIAAPVYLPNSYPGSHQVTKNEAGVVTGLRFVPNLRFAGTASFVYTVRHAGGTLTATAELVVSVSPAGNALPVFEGLPATLDATEDTDATFSFVVRDADVALPAKDNLQLTVTSDNLQILQDANIEITPAPVQGDADAAEYTVKLHFEADANTAETARYGGGLSLTLTAADGAGGSVTETLPVTVAPVNDAPVLALSDVTLTMDEDTTATFTVTVSDVDMPANTGGYTLSVSSDTPLVLPKARITVGAPQRSGDALVYLVTLKPLPNANTSQAEFSLADVTLSVAATDGSLPSNSETLTLTVTPKPDDPVAAGDSYTIRQDVKTKLYVLENDHDPDGDATMRISAVDGASAKGGALSIETDSQGRQYISYEPPLHYYGADSFGYTVEDDTGRTDTATVSITLTYFNYPPVFNGLKAEADRYVTPEDTRIEIPFSVYDDFTELKGLNVQPTIIQNVGLVEAFGVKDVNEAQPGERVLWVKPADNKNSHGGKYVKFQLRLGDGVNYTTHKITLEITPENDPPVAVPVTLQFGEGFAQRYEAAEILSRCSDVDSAEGDAIRLAKFGVPSSGSLKAFDASDIEVTGDGDIAYFIYTPVPYFDGTATVPYVIRDRAGEAANSILSLRAIPVNDPPTFLQPTPDLVMDEDGEWTLPLVFSDPETAQPVLILKSDDETVVNASCMTYTYTPTGADLTIKPLKDRYSDTPFDLTITVSDGTNRVDRTVHLTVRAVPDKPNVPDQHFTTLESTELYFNPLLNCTDVDDGDTLSLVPGSITPVESIDSDGTLGNEVGTVTYDSGTGGWVFTPEAGFIGDVWYEYTVQDSHHGVFTYPATFTTPGYPNYPGIGANDSYDGRATGRLRFTVGTSSVGPSVRRLPPVTAYAGQEMGDFTLITKNVPAGTDYTFKVEVIGGPVDPDSVKIDGQTPPRSFHAAGENPQHILNFSLRPGVVASGVVRVSITVGDITNSMSFRVETHAENKPPVVKNDPIRVSGVEGQTFDIDVITLAEITDPEGQKLSFGTLTTSGIGNDTVEVKAANGGYVLEYAARQERNARNSPALVSFGYTVVDEGGVSNTGTVEVEITSSNHAPYTWSYYYVQPAAVGETVTIDNWYARASDYDSDTRYLENVWCLASDNDSDGNAATAITFDGTDKNSAITFTAGKSGWVALRFQVKSAFRDDPATYGWNKSNAAGSIIWVYVPATTGGVGDLIPPRASGGWREFAEDAGNCEIEITSWLFGDGSTEGPGSNPNLEFVGQPELTNNGGARARLENVRLEKENDAGKHRYYIRFGLVQDSNSYNDDDGNLTGTLKHTQIKFTVKNTNDTNPSAPTAAATAEVRIRPVNDLPVIDDLSAQVESTAPVLATEQSGVLRADIVMDRQESTTLRFKVTDPDYPDQSLCDSQVRVAMTSTNNLAVVANQCVITPPTGGSGEWTVRFSGFTPGSTVLTLTAYDGAGGANLRQTQVHVTVTGNNHAPVAQDYYAVFLEDKKASVTVFDDNSDQDGDPLEIVLGTNAGLPGKVSTDGDKIIFIPNNDFCHAGTLALNPGTATKPGDWLDGEQIEISYQLRDPTGALSEEKKVFLHFNPENDAPRFVGTQAEQSITEGRPGTITFKVMDVDSVFDVDGNPEGVKAMFGCEFTDTGRIESAVVTDVAKTLNGDGTYTYTVTVTVTPKPYQCHHGSDCSTLVLKVRDDQNAEATFDLKLTITPVNDNPMFASDDYSDPLRVTLDNKRLSTKEDTPITIDLTAYYMDPDGPDEKLYIIWLDDAPVNGTVVYQDNKAVFSPSADYFTENEADYGQWGSFGYTIADSSNGPAHGTVQIFIEPVNDPPVLKEKSYTGEEDEPLLIEDLFTGAYNKNATVWDIDNLREELAIVAVGKGSAAGVTTAGATTGGGTVAVVQQSGKDWAIRYTPALDFTGTDTFWYTVSDGEDETTQKITLRITASDDPPRGNFENSANWAENIKVEVDRDNMPTWSFDEDGTGTFKFMMWDPEGNLMLFDVTAQDFNPATSNCATLAQLLPSGAITNGGTGLVRTVTIKPAADKYGSFNLKFVLDDGLLKTTYIVPVVVRPVNDAPALDDAAFSVDEDQTLSNRVTGRDLETPAAQLGYIWDEDKAGPDHGVVTVHADGSFDYTPAANYFGEDAFYIKMSDKGATGADDGVLSVSAKVTVTVNPVNDAPGVPADFSTAGGAGPYKGGTAISLSWTGGEDLPFETHRQDLTYLAEYRVDGGAWTAFTLANVSRNGSFEYTGEIPASVTAGKNTGRFDVRIATRDDGKVYKPDDVSLLKQLAALNSGYAQLTDLQIDSTPPTMGHTLSPAGWTNGNEITISLSAAAGSLGGATPIDRIEMEQSGSFAPIGTGAAASTKVTENGTYKFRAYDAVGNESTVLEVVVATFDRVKPTVTASPAAITGKTVEDGPSVTLTFADGLAPSGSKDKVSGLRATAGKQYQLTAAGDGYASGAWLDYTAPVTFPAKGSYTLHARVVDNAGNETIESFTGYVIDNAAPRVTNKTAAVYEHSLADANKKNSFAVSLAGTDADGDTLSYTMVDDAAYQTLKGYGSFTLNSATGAAAFTHNGNDVLPAHTALSLSCTVSDGTASVVVKLDVEMYPVNDAPTEAADLELQSAKAYYKAGKNVTLGWTAGSDSETAPGALRNEVEYRTAATGSWASAGSYVTGAASLALTTPNTGTTALQYRVRVWDNNTADPNRDGSTAPAASGWAYSPSYTVDNAPPTATHSFAPFSNNDGDSHAVVTLAPADGTEAWQSGVQSVAEPSGAQVIDAARYIYKITSGTPHSFVITDRAGNTTSYVVTANLPADPVIAYTQTHVRHGTEIPVSWTHTSPGSHYELEVTYDDGATWTTVVPESLNHTAKTYNYRVPSSFAAAPDTAKMRFRVRAWDAGGMHSVNWDAGAAIICDSTPPTITLTPDIETPTAGNVTVGYQVEDAPAGVATVVVNTGAGDTSHSAGGAAQYSDNLVITGNTTVRVSATDACGNTHSASYVVANIDKSFPTVGLTAVSKGAVMAEGSTTPAPIDFTLEFADLGIGGLVDRQYAITATNARPTGGWTDAAADTVTENAAAIGTYYVHMRAQDGVGNETYRCFGPFAVVNTQPVAHDLHYQVEEGGTLLITLNATDETPGDSIAAYTLLPPGPDYGTLTPKGGGQYEYQHDGVDPIANTSFTYYATDSHGEDSNTATVSITVVEVNDPPVLENLPADLTMTWNTSQRLEGELHDPDHLFATLRVEAQSSDPAILPLSRISLGYTRDSADENAGKLTLVLRPLRGTYTQPGQPVRVTLTASDPLGATHEVTLDVTVEQKPLPPTAQDQHYFATTRAVVQAQVNAEAGAMGERLEYRFGAPDNPALGSFSAAGGESPAFSFEAAANFTNGSKVAVPVTIIQHNSDGSTSQTAISLRFQSEAVTTEKKADDEVVLRIPGLSSSAPAGTELTNVAITSDNEEILSAKNCRVVVLDDGSLELYYAHEPYRYGAVTVTIATPNGTVRIPIVILPVNDPPAVENQYRAADPPAEEPAAAGLSAASLPEGYKGGAKATIKTGQQLEGRLVPDDELDNNPAPAAPHDRSYASGSFVFRLVGQPENGVVDLRPDGSYLYTPNAGFAGADSFYVLVEEAEGFEENQNPAPAGLPDDVEDVTLNAREPMLARHYQVSITVKGKGGPGKKPAELNDDFGGTLPSPGADTPGGTGQPAAGAEQAPADGTAAPDAPVDVTILIEEAEAEADAGAMADAAAVPVGRKPAQGSLYGLLAAAALAGLFLLLLLPGSVVRVRYHYSEAGERKRKTRYLVQRVHFRDDGEDYIRLVLPGEDFHEGTTSVHVHFGWWYRRRFYEHTLIAIQGEAVCKTLIPEKDEYKRGAKGVRLLPGNFRAEKAAM